MFLSCKEAESSPILFSPLKIFAWVIKWYQKAICVSVCRSNCKKCLGWFCCCASYASLFLTDGLLLCLPLPQQDFLSLHFFFTWDFLKYTICILKFMWVTFQMFCVSVKFWVSHGSRIVNLYLIWTQTYSDCKQKVFFYEDAHLTAWAV